MSHPESSKRETNPGATSSSRAPDWSIRTAADLKTLLLELARALRGLAYYPENDPHRAPLVDRAYRALQSELTRAGAIDLRLEPDALGLEGSSARVPLRGALQDLARALARHRIERLRIDPTLTSTALQGLLELLADATGRFDSVDRFMEALAARDATGLCLNGLEPVGDHAPRKLSATPLHASASLGSGLLAQPAVGRTHTAPRPPTAEASAASFERAPLDTPADDDRGERLRARLLELDRMIDDDAYCALTRDIVTWARELGDAGLARECYRAILVLADHAVGCGGRSETQARAAAAAFAELASGSRLTDLIDRAAGTAPEGGVRAAQLLLQLGAPAAPALFTRIAASQGTAESDRLRSLALTLGEAMLPTLVTAIEGSDEERARTGLRLAGELQNPSAVPALRRALRSPDRRRRLETIRALALLPGKEARETLEGALVSDLDEMVVAASEALAERGGAQSVPALIDVLEASHQNARTPVSVRLIAALGRIGDERAVETLVALLERRPLLRRAHWDSLQLAAVDALALLDTPAARRGVEYAAAHATRPVRARARAQLGRSG